MNIKLGLIGAPRSGKSLIGNFLLEKKGFKQFAFADQVKKDFFSISDYSEEDFEWAKRYNNNLEQEIRKSLWDYSDDMKKENGKFYFIRPVVDKIKDYNGDVIVTDIRTLDEMNALIDIGAKLIVISRSDLEENMIRGTRIPYRDIVKFAKFNNCFKNLKDLYKNFEIFFREEIMDADSEGGSCKNN